MSVISPRHAANMEVHQCIGVRSAHSGRFKSKRPPPSRSRPNWITRPGPKSGSAGKSESLGPENGVPRWRRPNSDIYSQNHHSGLVYDMIYQFLSMEAKNHKFGMFCQQCHPSVASVDADIRPRFPDSHLPFVYVIILSISPIWIVGETNP